jgi:DNA repair exonuclease SbcCD nuclease subunit
LRILCTGDVHIGRRSTRLPTHLDGHAHSCSLAWARFIDRAVAEQVDVVCISGDLVDQSNRYLEAIGPIEQGLGRLTGAGIDTMIVAGNHDHDVLPALIDEIRSPRVRLLGRSGRWERVTLERSGRRLNVDGWSFPLSHHLSNPLREYSPTLDGVPTLALLHADMDERGSRYAPISVSDMRRFPETLFILGHIHSPRSVREESGASYLYPGSPQAIDRSETGSHGAVLLELFGEDWSIKEIPLSSVRYEPLEMDVEGVVAAEEIDGRLSRAARERLDVLAQDAEHLECVRFRLKLSGRTQIAKEIEARVAELADDLELVSDEVIGTIESYWSAMSPAHDLEALAGGIGAPAVLAGMLASGPDDRLKARLRRLVEEIHGSRSFAEVSGGYADLEDMERDAELELNRAATVLLDELMAGRGAP